MAPHPYVLDIMKFFLQVAFIVRSEARYLIQFPKLMASAAVLALVPAMYCLLYITSVWDPETKTAALPVGVVNLDQGVQYKEHTFNVGWEITTRLEDSGRFGFTMLSDETKARQLVRQGKLAFAVIIPSDFSANAVPGAESGAGRVVIFTSQGNNFETAAIAKHFAETLERDINESLNERRWVLVLHTAAGSQQSLEHLHAAVNTLHADARDLRKESAQTGTTAQELAIGTRHLNASVTQIAAEARQLRGTAKALDSTRNSNTDLDELTRGANELAGKAANLLNVTQQSSHRVGHLLSAIDLLSNALPKSLESLGESSAEGLAHSVTPVLEIDAPVENSGSGFASNVVPGALWLGAATAAFLIHIRILPRQTLFFSRPARVIGKMFLPACVVLAQGIFIFIAVCFILKIHVANPWLFASTLALSSLSFLSIVFALSKAFGDAGKEIAMVLLAVQLSSSGGILPVELSGGLFAIISPWLPLTWVVGCIKVGLFNAYAGAWQLPMLQIGLGGLVSFAMSCSVGRWRFVNSSKRIAA